MNKLIIDTTGSEYYTTDPDQACIFVPVLDLLNEFQLKEPGQASKALEFASYPHWSELNNGENHLLFSFYPGSLTSSESKLDLNHGRAMVAAAGLATSTYRTGFDVSLPTYSILQENLVSDRSSLLSRFKLKHVLQSIQCTKQMCIQLFSFRSNWVVKIFDEDRLKKMLLILKR